ncbi:hypothetical protein TNCV_26981 [Trichonephila clavipes]|uniref:Uncharacterized protein n=1 Tax=Trichonephila clavipes TaxID=2585209 RepID=A0A8X6WL44_TRICX|nr:hypothetical protein TNCV_26981 [Trichonephila clavipes]
MFMCRAHRRRESSITPACRSYLSNNHDGRQTCADDVVTDGSVCVLLILHKQTRWTSESVIHVKRSSLAKWLIAGVAYSEKEGRVWRMKVEMKIPLDPQMETSLLEYKAWCISVTWKHPSSLVKKKSPENRAEMKQAVKQSLALQSIEFYRSGFFKLIAHDDKCLNVGGDYIGKEFKVHTSRYTSIFLAVKFP